MSYKLRPKLAVLWPVSRNSLGKEFHSLGPSTENAPKATWVQTVRRADDHHLCIWCSRLHCDLWLDPVTGSRSLTHWRSSIATVHF